MTPIYLPSSAGPAGLATTGITGTLTLTKTGTTPRTLTAPDAAGTIALTSDLPTLSTLGLAGLATTGITGTLTLTKTGSTPRTITIPDAAGTVGLLEVANVWTTTQRINATEALGLNTAVTVGNGLLQLTSGTTRATGIALGTDAFIYRAAANHIRIGDSGTPILELYTANNTVPTLRFGQNGVANVCSIGANGVIMEFRSNGGTLNMSMNDTTLGFFGNRIGKPTITGSRGGNAALANLLTNLASYGLITDSTTA